MNQLVVILVLLPVAVFAMTCTTDGDYVAEYGCRYYTKCSRGNRTVIYCNRTQAFNTDTEKCDDADKVPPPCGTTKRRDCSQREDGLYADTEFECRFYYTCSQGAYLGHNFCPRTTRFSEEMQGCLFPGNIDPPCGTRKRKS